MQTITDIEQIVSNLPQKDRQVFNRIFKFSVSTGYLSVPNTFREKIWGYFKQGDETVDQTVKRVSNQVIVKTFNKYTLEGALFNELRTCKPGNRPEDTNELRDGVFKEVTEEHKTEPCDLCEPEKYTPLDLPERLEEKGHMTIANAAKYDAANGMVVFKEFNPLVFTEEDFSDWMSLASQWFEEMHKQNENLIYPFLIWNCLPRAGASRIHGHMHILLTGEFPYEGVERLKHAGERYSSEGGDYFQDLVAVHKSLDLGLKYSDKGDVIVYLTPTKDKETLVIASEFEDLTEPLYRVIRCFIDEMGVFAFNLGVQMPPLVTESRADSIPYVARVVDRGNPLKQGTDFAGMELFGSKVIGSDPFKVAGILKQYMNMD